jgi:hypothetical protein
MSDRIAAISLPASSAAAISASAAPVAARTKLLLEAPVLARRLRLSTPRILYLLAIAGMITFDGLFVGRRGPCGARDEFHLAAIAQNLHRRAKLIPDHS